VIAYYRETILQRTQAVEFMCRSLRSSIIAPAQGTLIFEALTLAAVESPALLASLETFGMIECLFTALESKDLAWRLAALRSAHALMQQCTSLVLHPPTRQLACS